jgi:SAM-dependent methyltransferase
VSFNVDSNSYQRFIGRYSEPLAVKFAALADFKPGQDALDVGCGPGALTTQLVERLGQPAVAAIDPSELFVEAVRSRFPQVDVRRGSAEELPFPDDRFDCVLAQLVVHFMTDSVTGLREMARVARPDGVVGACVWDHAGGTGPLAVFWRAVVELDPEAHDESGLNGVREGHLAELFTAAGLRDIDSTVLTVRVGYAGFDEWWETFTLGVGPAGAYVASLDNERRERLRARCAQLLPTNAPFEISAAAWTVLARA